MKYIIPVIFFIMVLTISSYFSKKSFYPPQARIEYGLRLIASDVQQERIPAQDDPRVTKCLSMSDKELAQALIKFIAFGGLLSTGESLCQKELLALPFNTEEEQEYDYTPETLPIGDISNVTLVDVAETVDQDGLKLNQIVIKYKIGTKRVYRMVMSRWNDPSNMIKKGCAFLNGEPDMRFVIKKCMP